MNSKPVILGVVLLVAGGAIESLETAARSAPAGAECSIFAVAGGWRTIAADWFWLETNLAWERHDAVETRRLIKLTLAADPASNYYQLNAARILAYDLPAWARECDSDAPVTVQRRQQERAADEAIALLTEAAKGGERRADFEVEMGNICLYALGDRARAAEYYSRAAERPNAPAYAARLAARLRDEASGELEGPAPSGPGTSPSAADDTEVVPPNQSVPRCL